MCTYIDSSRGSVQGLCLALISTASRKFESRSFICPFIWLFALKGFLVVLSNIRNICIYIYIYNCVSLSLFLILAICYRDTSLPLCHSNGRQCCCDCSDLNVEPCASATVSEPPRI